MNDLRTKITHRLDQLQAIMESNKHIDDPHQATVLANQISMCWSILSEEDRNYLQCAQDAIEMGSNWGERE